MDKALSQRLAQGATLVVDDRLTAVQLEAYIAREANLLTAGAWRSPNVVTHDEFCASLWTANFGRDRLLLSGAQSDALWRSVIAASVSGSSLVDTARIARWARQAWSLLHAWRLDFRELRAREDDAGFAEFLTWAAQFQETLLQSGWLDAGALAHSVAERLAPDSHCPSSIAWADVRTQTPVQQSLLRILDQAGCDATTWAPESVTRTVHRVGLEDAQQELLQALHWAQSKIDNAPTARVALVVPKTVENDLRLARFFDDTPHSQYSSYQLADGSSLDKQPIIGAALGCLGLFSGHAGFQDLGRLLRSPFLGDGVEALPVRCLAEAELRGGFFAQLGFLTAYRSAGLDRQLGRRAPILQHALTRTIERLGRMPRYQSPTRWVGVAQEILNELGWPGADVSINGPVLDAWHRALEELSSMTPVLGQVDYERAFAELRASVSRTRIPSRVSLEGVTVLSRLEDLGPGYTSAWIMGMSDRLWPRSAEPSPLLPHQLQAVQEMPFATPADAVQRCRKLTDRLIARVPEIVFSYPLIENEFTAAVSPLLRDIGEIDTRTLSTLETAYVPRVLAQQTEDLDDPVPPFCGRAIAGGAGTLATQAQCPLRAFVDSRLSALPLDSPDRGFGARQRGILVHRALELLFAALPGQQQLAALNDDALAEQIRDCVDRAVRERVRGAGRSLRVYAALERDRLMPLILELIGLELARSDFVVEKLEMKLTAQIGGLDVGCRIDRIDTLADGSLAVIDYKTGLSATPADWFKTRLLEPQLPLYTQVVETDVDAVVIGRVHPRSVTYRGIWQQSGTFPGSSYRSQERLAWPEQRARWGAQLEALVAEYAEGDGRIFLASVSHAEGVYAPLTRVYEQLARAGGQSQELSA